jgi:hypothetical protein
MHGGRAFDFAIDIKRRLRRGFNRESRDLMNLNAWMIYVRAIENVKQEPKQLRPACLFYDDKVDFVVLRVRKVHSLPMN